MIMFGLHFNIKNNIRPNSHKQMMYFKLFCEMGCLAADAVDQFNVDVRRLKVLFVLPNTKV